ncbi:3-keto-5-aminohexanoate cleavage protein, partial [Rhizobium ecuadorense]
MKSVAIAVAPNGGRKTKLEHPNLPLTATELAETAVRCRE